MLTALSYLNHFYSLRSSSIILLFWPVYLASIAVSLRTRFSQLHKLHGRDLYTHVYGEWNATGKAEIAMFAASLGFGIIAWAVEIVGPEQSGIRIGEEIDYVKGKKGNGEYEEVFSEDGENGTISEGDEESVEERAPKKTMEEKVAMEDAESPVLRANIYSRLTFGYLTRELCFHSVSVRYF